MVEPGGNLITSRSCSRTNSALSVGSKSPSTKIEHHPIALLQLSTWETVQALGPKFHEAAAYTLFRNKGRSDGLKASSWSRESKYSWYILGAARAIDAAFMFGSGIQGNRDAVDYAQLAK